MKTINHYRAAFKKQREINRRLQQQLRAETMLSNALADLRWLPQHQTPAQIRRVKDAIALKQSLAGDSATTATFYPTGRKAA